MRSSVRGRPAPKLAKPEGGESSPPSLPLSGEGERAVGAADGVADWLAELYEAAADAGRWPRALGAAAGRLGAARAALEVVDLSSGAMSFAAQAVVRWRTRSAGGARIEQGSAPPADGSPLALHIEGRSAVCRFPLRGTASVARLSLARGPESRPWSEADRDGIARIVAHLERALRLGLRVRSADPDGAARPATRPPAAPPPTFWAEIEAELQTERGLTPCEARVAVRFAQGGSVRQVAHRLRVSVETVRTHLKRIYQKLGTTRQAELVRLLLTRESAVQPPAPRDS